jgi:uncharacterized protein DUF6748
VASRFGVTAALLVSSIAVAASAARQPPTGTAMYLVQPDPRMCPSPRCGGYWATIANGARTRCADGARQPRCYVARAVDRYGKPVGSVPDGALVRGAILAAADDLDLLQVRAVYAQSGTASASGGYYRVADNGIRCIRAPCFSYRVAQVNGSSRVLASQVDLEASGATSSEIDRAQVALRTKDGLYAQGTLAPTADGGRVFRALRFYLRAPLQHA